MTSNKIIIGINTLRPFIKNLTIYCTLDDLLKYNLRQYIIFTKEVTKNTKGIIGHLYGIPVVLRKNKNKRNYISIEDILRLGICVNKDYKVDVSSSLSWRLKNDKNISIQS